MHYHFIFRRDCMLLPSHFDSRSLILLVRMSLKVILIISFKAIRFIQQHLFLPPTSSGGVLFVAIIIELHNH